MKQKNEGESNAPFDDSGRANAKAAVLSSPF